MASTPPTPPTPSTPPTRRSTAGAAGRLSRSQPASHQTQPGNGKHHTRQAHEQAHEDDAALLERVRQRLGITAPLAYQRTLVPLDRLVVRDVTPSMRRDAHLLAANLKIAGMLNPPSTIPLHGDADREATAHPLEVFLGRRRVLAAQLLWREEDLPGWDQLWCHIYDLPDDPILARRMRALLTLSENGCRSPAWVEELRRLVEFLDHPVPLTDQEIWTSLGMPPGEAKARLKLARLPRPILEQIFAGQITSQSLLHRVARLTPDQRRGLAKRAEAGEEITPLLVDQALRGQIAAGLAIPVLQESLGKGWEVDEPLRMPMPAAPVVVPVSAPPAREVGAVALPCTASTALSVPQEEAQRDASAGGTITQALAVLRALLPVLAGDPRLTQAHLLTEALIAELEPEGRRGRPIEGAAA